MDFDHILIALLALELGNNSRERSGSNLFSVLWFTMAGAYLAKFMGWELAIALPTAFVASLIGALIDIRLTLKRSAQ